VASGDPLERALRSLTRPGASDLLLIPGSVPLLRVEGRLELLDLPVPLAGELRRALLPHMGRTARRQLETTGAADLSLRLPAAGSGADESTSEAGGWRLRVNVHYQRGELAAAVRVLPQQVPDLARLSLPPTLAGLVRAERGLVLVCGPTGVGKTSTLAAMVDVVNRGSSRHIITIEDPVEYEHRSRSSVIEQVEVGTDAVSFASALRAALRRNPDIILVGEMRDLETISTVLTAAETGHLILATLHTRDVGQAVHRIIDVFGARQQAQVRQQLALSLAAIVCQQLAIRSDGAGRVPAVEVLTATYAVRNHIRKGEVHQLYNQLLMGRGQGMVSMEESLLALVRQGLIDRDEALARCNRPDELERLLGSRADT
jgi:twitching motility protein PilT